MKSSIVKRSLVINRHKTSVSLEEPFWTDLKAIAQKQQMTLSELVGEIDRAREQNNLSSAVRLFVLKHFMNLCALNGFNNEQQLEAKALPSSVVSA